MRTYTVTADEERLDRIAKKLYGTEKDGTVELLLNANPGLADLGPFVPLNRTIRVPDKPAVAPAASYQRPWE